MVAITDLTPGPWMNNQTTLNQLVTPVFLADPWTSMGPTVVPWPIDSFLLGIFLSQLVSYVERGSLRADPNATKATVLTLTALVLITTGVIWAGSCSTILTYAGQYWPYLSTSTLLPLSVLQIVTSLTVQTYFAWRIYILYERRPWLPILVATLNLFAAGGAVALSIFIGRSSFIVAAELVYAKRVELCFGIAFYGSIACDVTTSGLLVYALVRVQSSWSSTKHLLHRLIFLTMSSALPPTIFTIAVAIQFARLGTLTTLTTPYVMLNGKLYAVSLLYVLNARSKIRDGPSLHVSAGTYHNENETELRSRNMGLEGLRRKVDASVLVKSETHIDISQLEPYRQRERHAGLRDPSSEDVNSDFRHHEQTSFPHGGETRGDTATSSSSLPFYVDGRETQHGMGGGGEYDFDHHHGHEEEKAEGSESGSKVELVRRGTAV